MESPRLVFREIEEDDAAFIVDVRSEPDVYRYFVDPHRITLKEHLNWFHNIYPYNDRRTDYIALDKATGERVGVFGLILTGDAGEKAEINYLIRKEYQRRGLAAEGVECLLGYAASELRCNTALAEIHEENTASLALAGKLGFVQTGRKDQILYFEKPL